MKPDGMLSRRLASPYLLLTLANLFWAGNWIIGRALRDDVPPVALSFWRWAVALGCLLPVALPNLRADLPRLRAALPWLFVFGVLGTSGYNVLAYTGLQYTTAINGLLLNSCVPVAIVVLSWGLQGRRMRLSELFGLALSLAGVLAIITQGSPAALLGLTLNRGDLWVLASVLAWSAYTLLLQHRPAVHPMSFLLAITITGLVALLPVYLWELGTGRMINPTLPALAGIAYTGIFPAFLGYILWNRGVAAVGPSGAGLFMHLVPAFGIVLSMLFLGEQPRPHHALGIGCIFAGIWLTMRPQR